MKQQLLFAAAMICSVCDVNGQHFEVGLNAGMAGRWESSTHTADKSRKDIVTSGIDLTYGNGKYAAGLSVSWMRSRQTYMTFMPVESASGSFYCSTGPGPDAVTIASDLIPVALSGDRRFAIGRSQLYIGVTGGVAKGYQRAKFIYDARSFTNYYQSTETFDYFAGLHAGCTWYMGKRLGLNAEVSGAKYNFVTQRGPEAVKVYYVPLTVGLRYKL